MKVGDDHQLFATRVIPPDWKDMLFRDICWVNQGLQIAISKRLKYPNQNSKKYITIQYLNDGKSIEYIDDYVTSVCCEKTDVLMTRTGNTGIVITNVEGVFHNNFFKINYDKNLINKDYLVYYLNLESTKRLILAKAGTSTIPDLNHKDFYSIQIVLPTALDEQSSIANALSDADALITSLEKLIAKKRNIKQGAMQELLKPKKGWETRKLGEIAEIRDGTHQTPKYVEQGIPFYSVESVTSNNFVNTKFISEEEHRFLTKSYKMEKGDILMTRIGSIGDCKLINWDVDASFYVSLALLKIKKTFSANFIYHYSKSSYFKKEIELNSLQTAIPKKINLGPISNVKVELPGIEEQNRIASVLSDMENEVTFLESKLEKYCQIKSGMMQNLLTGKIRLV